MAEPSPTKTAEQVAHLEALLKASGIKPGERRLDAGIQPNQLDQFDQPTYHFRLYMMGDEATRTRRFGPSSRLERIVIAETGVTSTEIDNVEISSVTGMSKGQGVGVATNFSFTLTQPFGASLLDEIVHAANVLGVQNYTKCPFYLELSFRGRTREDADRAANSDFNNLIWVWPIVLNKMQIDINAGGSVYAVEGNLYSDMAYTNQASDIDKAISIDAETVGEFFSKFATELNKREDEKNEADTATFPDTISFKIDSDIYNEKIVPPSTEERQNRSATFDKVDGKMRITFQAPTDINQITRNVLSLTDYFQKKAKGTDDADSQAKDNGGEDAIFQTIYRVVADAQMGKFDTIRQDYQRHYRYLIIPYSMTTLQTQSNEYANLESPERYAAIFNRGLLTKRYDYLYTGLNDQVLDFEIVFNFNWYAALPLQGGRYTPRTTEVSAAKTDTQKQFEQGVLNINDVAAFVEEKLTAQFPSSLAVFTGWSLEDFLKNLVPQEVTDLQETVEENINAAQLQASDIMGQVTDQITTVTETAGGAIENVQAGMTVPSEFIGGLPPINIIPAIPAIGNALGGFTAAQTASMAAILQSKTQFPRVSDPSNPDAAAAQKELLEQDYLLEDLTRGEKEVQLFKTTYIESSPGKSQGGTGSLAASPGQNMLSALFEQAETPLTGDLLDITLKIKGDPYWLEPNPTGRNEGPLSAFERAIADRETQNDGDQGDETSFNGVVTTNQQTYFVFRNFTPQQFDAETGITPKNSQGNSLNGIYGVRTVQHSFSGGQFTQELSAIRDPKINLKGIDLDNPTVPASISPDASSLNTAEPVADLPPFEPNFTDVTAFTAGAGDINVNAGVLQDGSFDAQSLLGKMGSGTGPIIDPVPGDN